MYEIEVSASEFAGISLVKQHKLVAAALPVKSWHGFVVHTKEA
jgi:stress-induced morphogen